MVADGTNKKRILLLTNRDSENVGDQIIEATVISIIHGAMNNLGFTNDEYAISSRAAGIITRRYMATGDETEIESARQSISESDLIIFGGAPLFNYAYQLFYKRTIITLELAQEYGVPVLFSSIGVEPFDASNPKCMQLKAALNLPCVRQITTRDDYDSVLKYVEGTDIKSAKVSDPAVLADIVFRNKPATPKPAPPKPISKRKAIRRRVIRLAKAIMPAKAFRMLRKTWTKTRDTLHKSRPNNYLRAETRPLSNSKENAAPKTAQSTPSGVTGPTEPEPPRKPRIGLVVTRANIFRDNRIDFSAQQQEEFWLNVISLLTDKGYDFKLLTTGHFSDEVFLEELVRKNNLSRQRVKNPVNRPEDLIQELRACDGVIAFRLHASITSFAFKVPSIGLSWNFKVPYFYDSVGYGHRALDPSQWNAEEVVDALEHAIADGVSKDPEFTMSVYSTLFEGMRDALRPASEVEPYTLEQLKTKLPRNTGTSYKLYRERIGRKLRRTYENYPKLDDKK